MCKCMNTSKPDKQRKTQNQTTKNDRLQKQMKKPTLTQNQRKIKPPKNDFKSREHQNQPDSQTNAQTK